MVVHVDRWPDPIRSDLWTAWKPQYWCPKSRRALRELSRTPLGIRNHWTGNLKRTETRWLTDRRQTRRGGMVKYGVKEPSTVTEDNLSELLALCRVRINLHLFAGTSVETKSKRVVFLFTDILGEKGLGGEEIPRRLRSNLKMSITHRPHIWSVKHMFFGSFPFLEISLPNSGDFLVPSAKSMKTFSSSSPGYILGSGDSLKSQRWLMDVVFHSKSLLRIKCLPSEEFCRGVAKGLNSIHYFSLDYTLIYISSGGPKFNHTQEVDNWNNPTLDGEQAKGV